MRRSVIAFVFALFLAAIPAHAQTPYVGQIDIVPYNFAPVNWAFCDGSLLSISENAALFDLIGTTYGGNGQTTFALPDLRGRMAIHQGSNGVSTYIMGEEGGSESVTLTLNQLPAHTHAAMGNSTSDSLGPGSNVWGTATTYLYSSIPTPPAPESMYTGVVGATGGGQPYSNLPPFLVMNFVIALYGVFPSQN